MPKKQGDSNTKNFWETKTLSEMTAEEWESLCDGCGQCCLHKFEDVAGSIYTTDVACKYLDLEKSKCSVYKKRKSLVPACFVLTPDNVSHAKGLPKTCAYRLLSEGKKLFDWHPLISKSADAMKESKISVLGRVISESDISAEKIQERITAPIDLK